MHDKGLGSGAADTMAATMPLHPTRRSLLSAALAAALPVRGAAESEWRPWPRGRRMPPLELERLDGTPWRLDEVRGRVLLANFWASWCEPCRDEMPSLARLARRHAADGLEVAAINYREARPTIERFVARLALDGPLVMLRDREGAAAAAWTPRILPSTVVFDRRSRPAGVLVGEIDWDGPEAAALVGPLLAAPAPARRRARLSSNAAPAPVPQGSA